MLFLQISTPTFAYTPLAAQWLHRGMIRKELLHRTPLFLLPPPQLQPQAERRRALMALKRAAFPFYLQMCVKQPQSCEHGARLAWLHQRLLAAMFPAFLQQLHSLLFFCEL